MDPEKLAQLRDFYAINQVAVPLLTPLWSETHGKIREPITGIQREYAVALVAGQDLTSNPKSWRDHKASLSDAMLGFMTLILACEDGDLGAHYIDKDPEADPGTYKAILYAIACVYTRSPKLKRDHYDIIKKHVRPSRYINLRQQRDIKEAVDQLRLEELKEKMSKAERKKDGGGNDDDVNVEPEPMEPSDAEKDISAVKEVLKQFENPLWTHFPKICYYNVQGGRSEIHPPVTMASAFPRNNPFFTSISILSARSHRDMDNELMLQSDYNSGLSTVMPKVLMTVSTFPGVGVLVRFAQVDPQWDPGREVHKLISDVHLRDTAKKSRFGTSFKEPWPQYMIHQGTGFPSHDLTWERWVKLSKNLNYRGPTDFDQDINQMGMQTRADSYNSPFHPHQIFTLERALLKLRQAGVDVGDIEQYTNADRTCLTWPQSVRGRTCRLLPEQVFWDSPVKAGLISFYFPFLSRPHPSLEDALIQNVVVNKHRIAELLPQGAFRTNNLLVQMEQDADATEMIAMDLQPRKLYEIYKSGQTTPEYDAYCKELAIFNADQMEKFESICCLEGTVDTLAISAPMRATLKWMQNFRRKNAHNTFEVTLDDPEMDFFANGVATEFLAIYQVNKIIRPLMSFKTQGLFAVAQRFAAKLLWSYIVFGQQAMGKSKTTTEFVMEMCTPGTTKKVDRKTKASEQTDMAIFDCIIVQEECKEALVDKKAADRDPEGTNMVKSAMTTGYTTTTTFVPIELPNGESMRGARDVISVLKYVLIASTNKGNIKSDAMASRFFKETMCRGTVPPRQMVYQVSPERKKAHKDSFRMYQCISYWVDKAMAVQAICKEPNMDLWYDIINMVCDALETWGVIGEQGTARVIDIMTNFARQMVIKNAINMTYNVRGAKYWNVPFHPSHLKHLQRYLYCTVQIAIFTITLLSNEIINDNLGEVLNAAYKVCCNDRHANWDENKTPYDIYQSDFNDTIKFKLEKNPSYSKDQKDKACPMLINLNHMCVYVSLEELGRMVQPYTRLAQDDCVAAFQRMSEMSFPPHVGSDDRNGYTFYPTTDILQHKGERRPKIVIRHNSMRIDIQGILRTLAQVYLSTVINKIGKFRARNQADCARWQREWNLMSDEAIVFLYAELDQWDCGPERIAQTLSDLSRIPLHPEDTVGLDDVVYSMFGVDSSWTLEYALQKLEELNYMWFRIIEHCQEQGYVSKRGEAEGFYLERQVLDGNDSCPYSHFACSNDIPQLNNTPVGEYHDAKIKVVDINPKYISFSPMAITLFDKNIIIEAIEHAVMCGTTKPGKRLLGWQLEDNSTLARTLNWSTEYINKRITSLNDNLPPEAENRFNGVPFRRRGYMTKAAMIRLKVKQNVADAPIEVVDDLDKWSATNQHMRCGFPVTDPVHTPEWIRENFLAHGGIPGQDNYPESLHRENDGIEKNAYHTNYGFKRSKLK